MRRRRWFSLFMTIMLFLVLPAASTAAYNQQGVSGKSSTVFEWFDDGQEETAQVVSDLLIS